MSTGAPTQISDAEPAARAQDGLVRAAAELAAGRPEQAATICRQALTLDPNSAQLHSTLGNALKALGRHQEAVAAHHEAVRLRPDFAEGWSNLGSAYKTWVRLEQAIDAFGRAVALRPHIAELHFNLGNALLAADRLEDAVVSFSAALERDPTHVWACVNLGTTLKEAGALDQAIECFRTAIAVAPNHADAHWNLALALLLTGQWREGWAEYEWRRMLPGFAISALTGPSWAGEPLDGRSLLLRAEQGLGDTIQFVRYAASVKALGGRAVVQCQPPLERLLAGCAGVDRIVSMGAPLPACDLQVPLASLPRLLGMDRDNPPPRRPYLEAEPDRVTRWAGEMASDGALKVGIAWQGNPDYRADHRRSIALREFLPLLRCDGIRFYNLQKGPGSEQLADLPPDVAVTDFGDALDRDGAFVDTAAVMRNLDLVISSDTAIPHLAGALGVEVWMALPHMPDWRWGLDGEISLWYPSMRIFRQTIRDDWTGVFGRMADTLTTRRR